MKKNILLLILILNAKTIFATESEIDLYTSVSEKKADSGIGIHIKGDADISAIVSQEFKDFEYNSDNTKRYGALIRLDKKQFFTDMTFYAGTLRFSGSYSRLKNPSLSSSSILGSLSFLQAGIKPALPTFSSSTQMEAIAIKTPVFSAAHFENGTNCWSIQHSSPFLSLALSGAQFIYGRKKYSSWFTKDRYFIEKKYSSYDAELCFNAVNILKSCNAVGIIENPFGGLNKSYLWMRTQDSLKINNIYINTALFHAWTPLMNMPSGKKAGLKNQFVLNPKITIHSSRNILNAGFIIQKNEKTTTTRPFSEYDEYSFRSEIAYIYNRTKLDFQYSASYSGKTNKTSYKTKFYTTYKYNSASITSSAGIAFDDSNRTFTFSSSLSDSKSPLTSIKFTDSIIFKNGLYENSKISGTATISFRWNNIKWQGKVALSTSF